MGSRAALDTVTKGTRSDPARTRTHNVQLVAVPDMHICDQRGPYPVL
jgi:hypothetical protein